MNLSWEVHEHVKAEITRRTMLNTSAWDFLRDLRCLYLSSSENRNIYTVYIEYIHIHTNRFIFSFQQSEAIFEINIYDDETQHNFDARPSQVSWYFQIVFVSIVYSYTANWFQKRYWNNLDRAFTAFIREIKRHVIKPTSFLN